MNEEKGVLGEVIDDFNEKNEEEETTVETIRDATGNEIVISDEDLEQEAIEKIIEHHNSGMAHGKGFLKESIAAGGLLFEQKAKLPHGEWGPWIEEHLPFSHATANLYMRLYEGREEIEANSERVHNLGSLRGALKLIAPPEEEKGGEQATQEIRKLYDELTEIFKPLWTCMVRAGELLVEQRSKMEPSEWEPWIEKNLSFDLEVAEDYMWAFENQERVAAPEIVLSLLLAGEATDEETGEKIR